MSGSKSKIVSLNTGRRHGSGGAGGHDGGAADPVSALLLRVHDRIKPILLRQMQTLFDQADDALFELADKAGSNGEQNLYFESMRELRIRRRGVELAMARDLQENLRCFARGASQTADVPVDPLSPESLALVTNDELEERVAIESMVSKAEKEFLGLLTSLTARLHALLPHVPVDIRTNPIGPAALCDSFLEATRDVRLDIKARLVLFKLFDRVVVAALGEFYHLADRHLGDEGVNPTMARPRSGQARGADASHAAGTADSGATTVAAGEDAEQFFADLQQLLDGHRPNPVLMNSSRQGLVAPGLAPPLPRDALLQLLGELQRQQLLTLATRQQVDPQPLDVLRSISDLLQQRLPGQTVSIGQVDDDAINLVSMLFQFVLEDRNLAAPVKGLIARLQIPILKVAMVDKTFFSKGGHPARKLLNELANASLGWVPSGDAERDPFYRRVGEAVSLVVDEFTGDIAVFSKAQADFSAYVEMERRRAALVEQRTIDAEDGRARSEVARRVVDQVLAERIGGHELPAVVGRLLHDGWSNVLFLVYLKEGADSEEWQQAVRTVDDLIASVAPVAGFEPRARLLHLLPSLLKRLRSGLSKVGVSPYDLELMFEELEQLHLDRLHSDEVRELVAEPAADYAAAEPAAPLVADGNLGGPVDAAAMSQPDMSPVDDAAVSAATVTSAPVGAAEELAAEAAFAEPVLAEAIPAEMAFAPAETALEAAETVSELVPLLTEVVGAAAVAEPASLPPVATATLDDVLASRSPAAGDASLVSLERELTAVLGEETLTLDEQLDGFDLATPVAPVAATALSTTPSAGQRADHSTDQSAGERSRGDLAASDLLRIDRLQVGGWVEFHQGDSHVVRCRLAAIIRATGKFIFVNRAGTKVAENTREGLAAMFGRGELTILDEGRLFDRALESVIGNLREMRERG